MQSPKMVLLPVFLSATQAASLSGLEQRLQTTYEALPRRGSDGLPSAAAVRYLAQRFLTAEHGRWVHGLDRTPLHRGRNATAHAARRSAQLLKAPAAMPDADKEALAKIQGSSPEQGFTLQEAAAFVKALENLLANSDMTVMRRAHLLAKRMAGGGGPPKLRAVLLTYAALHMSGTQAEDLYRRGMKDAKARRRLEEEVQSTIDKLRNDIDGEPLESVLRSAERAMGSSVKAGGAALAGMRLMRQKLDARQNYECKRFRGFLQSMDPANSGQVGYRSSFGVNMKDWALLETPEYLHAVGALQKKYTAGVGPGVLIPNYATGMNSCRDAASWHTSVCCPDDCELEILPRLEAVAEGSQLQPRQVWEALLPALKGTGRKAQKVLLKQLRRLGGQATNGTLALHSKAFGTWLHRAFPHKCRKPVSEGVPLVVDPALLPTAWEKGGKHLPLHPEEVTEVRGHLQRRWGKDGTGTDVLSFAARSNLGLDGEIQLIPKFLKVQKKGGPSVLEQLEDAINVRVMLTQTDFRLRHAASLACACVFLLLAGFVLRAASLLCTLLRPAAATLAEQLRSGFEATRERFATQQGEDDVKTEPVDEDSTDMGETDSETAGEHTSDSEAEDGLKTSRQFVYSRAILLAHYRVCCPKEAKPAAPEVPAEEPERPEAALDEVAAVPEEESAAAPEPTEEPAAAVCAPPPGLPEPEAPVAAPEAPERPAAKGLLSSPVTSLSAPVTSLSSPVTSLSGPVTGLSAPVTGLSGPATSLRPSLRPSMPGAKGKATGSSLISELLGKPPAPKAEQPAAKGEGSWRADAGSWRAPAKVEAAKAEPSWRAAAAQEQSRRAEGPAAEGNKWRDGSSSPASSSSAAEEGENLLAFVCKQLATY